jgi:hypothetical protein
MSSLSVFVVFDICSAHFQKFSSFFYLDKDKVLKRKIEERSRRCN